MKEPRRFEDWGDHESVTEPPKKTQIEHSEDLVFWRVPLATSLLSVMANGVDKPDKSKTKDRRGSKAPTFEETVMQMSPEIRTDVRGTQQNVQELKQEFVDLKKGIQEVKEEVASHVTRLTELETVRVPDVERTQQDALNTIAFLQMKERENQLRVRGVPQLEQDNLKDWLIEEFAACWDLEKDELNSWIERAYRFGPKKDSKIVHDCIAVFKTKEQRDNILGLHYKKSLKIKDKPIVLFKEIPKHFLNLRNNYADLAGALRRNNIFFQVRVSRGPLLQISRKDTKN
ncbi:Hypothetical predicted protein [Podarcis lilfordi]|uniref:L1 transposable element RRM domain-containing protein n=1 Tax=Podarcis lilfordi TaxID=74358 RepID=A0AA35LNE3_9SAUR|nr:Hypothetical predicted protein [Podarcis lilfordi]